MLKIIKDKLILFFMVIPKALYEFIHPAPNPGINSL